MFGFLTDDPVDISKLTASLIAHEGCVLHIYDDANGLPVVKGYTVVGNPTIGVGRLATTAHGLSESEAIYLLNNDITACVKEAQKQVWWPWVKDNDARARAFIEAAFCMGFESLDGFHDALTYASKGDWEGCADAFMDSLWAKQVGNRATIISLMIRDGV